MEYLLIYILLGVVMVVRMFNLKQKFYYNLLLGITTSLVVPTLIRIPAVHAEENSTNIQNLEAINPSFSFIDLANFSVSQEQNQEDFQKRKQRITEVPELNLSGATARELKANSTQAQDLSGTEAQSLPNTQNQPVFFSQATKQTIIPDRGFYISITPGLMFGYNIDTVSSVTEPSTIKTDTGFSVSGALGYKLRDFRVEAEFTYGRNDAKEIELENGTSTRIGGYFQTFAYMLNAYYDIPLTRRIRPYIGGGLGAATFSAEDIVQANTPTLSGSNTAFAYQFKVGIGYQLTDNVNVFVGYRLLGISGQDFERGTQRVEGDSFTTNSLQFGARIVF
ncbi:outer membrane protein [Aerosakkonemataceae cyanobacterium BLCC-F50]|uniref:Outer membrane protein n=1 Tax=Floridaenema flaviceps BLCC-F50 TaxID=3153642 RepID=A0ABV4Y2N1_9CYAN